jgi:hypothetical protein
MEDFVLRFMSLFPVMHMLTFKKKVILKTWKKVQIFGKTEYPHVED